MAVERWDGEFPQLLARAKEQQENYICLLKTLLEEIRGMRADAKRVADFLENKK